MNKLLLNSSLDQLLFKRICPDQLLAQQIQSGKRLDGRKFDEKRSCSIQTDYIQSADSSCIVRLGSTVIVCGVRIEVLPLCSGAKESSPIACGSKGHFIINVSFPMDQTGSTTQNQQFQSSSLHAKVNTVEKAQELSSQLQSIFLQCIDLHELAISSLSMVYCVYAEIVFLNADGSLLPAATTALSKALEKLMLFEVEVIQEVVHAVPLHEKAGKAFPLLCSPSAFSFGMLQGKQLVHDLNEFEEDSLDSTVTVVTDGADRVLFVNSFGAAFASLDKVLAFCINA
jgi:exosome complex component RRP43